jgi:outer membrane protein
MQEAVEKKKADYGKIMETMYMEYEKKAKEYQEGAEKMTPAVLELKMQELKDLEKRLGDFEQKAQADLSKFAEESMKPLNEKYVKGVKEVAKEQGFTYVLDIAQGGVIFFPETGGYDITSLVKTKIGATLTPTPAGSTAPKK